MKKRPRVVVCGGGAGGLELVVRLARGGDLDVVLIDREATHLWKPLLHEIASGSLDASRQSVPYLALARWRGFRFQQGTLEGLDRKRREVLVGAVLADDGSTMIPPRRIRYDLLVIAVGGTTSDFGVPGVRKHALVLDTVAQADEIRRRIVQSCIAANYAGPGERRERLDVVIVGGGATGVELAAELRSTTRTLVSYGLDHLDADDFVGITLLNADPRLLTQLPAALAGSVEDALVRLGIVVRNGEAVVEVGADHVRTRSGHDVKAHIAVWAAGMRAPCLLATLDGLETNRAGQLVVTPDLRVANAENVFAIGDCAACPWLGKGGLVPARAQASQQQAVHLARNIRRLVSGQPIEAFRYRDLGSLVSLGPQGSAIGTLMGFVSAGSYRVGGLLAGLFYRWLYKRHRAALFGWWAVVLETLGRWIGAGTRPRIKLH